MAIIDNPLTGGGGGGGTVDETSALQYMLNNKTVYSGIAAGLTGLVTFPAFTQPAGITRFEDMCNGCSSLTTLPSIAAPASGSTYYDNAFYGCTALTDASSLQTKNIRGCRYMFYNCSNLTTLPTFNVSSSFYNEFIGTDYMFRGCESLTSIDVGNLIGVAPTARSMFQNCYNLAQFTATGQATNTVYSRYCWNFQSMFARCRAITSITLNLSKPGSPNNVFIISAASMFNDCTALQSVTASTNGVQYLQTCNRMFYGCTALTSVTLAFDSAQNVNEICSGCTSLTNLTGLSFGSSVNTYQSAFNGCTSLTTVPAGVFDFTSITSASLLSYMFTSCSNLSNTSLNNIMGDLVATGTSITGSNKTLKNIGLTSAQATTCTGLSNWAALSAAGWTTGY